MREILRSLADEAARDPSRAAPIARYLADLLKQAEESEGRTTPPGYVYAGAHSWSALVDDLAIEPLPTLAAPNAAPIFSTFNEPTIVKVPFDALVIGVSSWGFPKTPVPLPGNEAIAVSLLSSCAWEGRDLFSVDWELDGKTAFSSDGRRRMMTPACVATGSRKRPRPMAWTLRRNQRIGVRFRNIMNAMFEGVPDEIYEPPLLRVGLTFHALNLDQP